jgi:hypothetical protein
MESNAHVKEGRMILRQNDSVVRKPSGHWVARWIDSPDLMTERLMTKKSILLHLSVINLSVSSLSHHRHANDGIILPQNHSAILSLMGRAIGFW